MASHPFLALPRSGPFALLLAIGGTQSAASASVAQAVEGGGRVRPAPVDVAHVEGEARMDGVLAEPFWQKATKFTLDIETRPADNTPASSATPGKNSSD